MENVNYLIMLLLFAGILILYIIYSFIGAISQREVFLIMENQLKPVEYLRPKLINMVVRNTFFKSGSSKRHLAVDPNHYEKIAGFCRKELDDASYPINLYYPDNQQ